MIDQPAQSAVQQCERLQRLAEVVTGCGEETAFRVTRPVRGLSCLIGHLPRLVRGLPRYDQLFLSP